MNEKKANDFTKGKILGPLLLFAGPVLLALFLQCMYGAVDLLIVGQFGMAQDVSAVSTGSQIMQSVTSLIASFAMGTTVLLGQMIGEGKVKKGGEVIGTALVMFLVIGVILTIAIPLGANGIASTMNAPEEAFDITVSYLRICGLGSIVIIAYNLIGSIFRGIGDSKTPLITVAIACCVNVVGDLLLVAGVGLGAVGAAIATVAAQTISVVISFVFIRKKELPFYFSKECIRFDTGLGKKMTKLGAPIALQDLLVNASFLVLVALVNDINLECSAGMGVAQKVCGLIMLVPLAFMQSMSAFVAQNIGARKYDRAKKALLYAIGVSFIFGILMFLFGYFKSDLLAGIFTKEPAVIYQASEYLKAYAIDCLFTCFLFCFIGFFNGIGYTSFVMIQGIAGAFAVRIPVAIFMKSIEPVTMFNIGLAIPTSTILQIILCGICFRIANKKLGKTMNSGMIE